MEVGTEIWVRDAHGDQGWVGGTIIKKERVAGTERICMVVRNEFGRDIDLQMNYDDEDSNDIKLKNNPTDALVENLINLPYLHEPAILYCLQERYYTGDIYTYTGPILIALNPFKRLPLYSNQTLEVYYNTGLLKSQGVDVGSPLAPHVYAIADAAYRLMMKSVITGHAGSYNDRNKGSLSPVSADQSILISGESGAGKTESTKIVLRYLTTVGNSGQGVSIPEGSVMDKVLQSNPILEAFGNARTLRNDNSSRFGKFIQLHFSKRGALIGGSIRTYLLEKVRLPLQQGGERNFHIFYQLAAGASIEEKMRWQFGAINSYEYTSKGGIYKLQHVDDGACFHELRNALNVLNFAPEDQQALLDAVVGILHLGQVQFDDVVDAEGEGSKILDNEGCHAGLANFARLCGLNEEDVVYNLIVRTIVARSETYQKKLTKMQASDGRDALVKAIYGRLFDWIVATINKSMEVDPHSIRANIGVLDIFGFESFQHNSFEQLCINYTNETLQQQFNQYIFKLEQLEYQKEQIEWSFIEFPDNKDCLDLIEHKVNGILAMIDDECRLPKASDDKLAGRMYKQFTGHVRFSASAAQKRDSKFCIRHYAGLVEYSTITFVDKNKDELPKEATALLQSSTVNLIRSLFMNVLDHTTSADKISYSGGAASSASAKKAVASMNTSVGSQFKEQLAHLMDNIYATTPHYIRCLKPNDKNEPDNFNRLRIVEQLRYGGVLEAVRVARSGFPVRLSHAEFYTRYRLLLSNNGMFPPKDPNRLPAFLSQAEKTNITKVKEYCQTLLWRLPLELKNVSVYTKSSSLAASPSRASFRMDSWSNENVQIGLTKVFLRKNAHDILEAYRTKCMHLYATKLQTVYRGHRHRYAFLSCLYACRLLQRMVRGMFARRLVRVVRHNQKAITVQRAFRRFICHYRYQSKRRKCIQIQCFYRCVKAYRVYLVLLRNAKAIRLQASLRKLYHSHRYRKFRVAVIVLQTKFRCIVAKKLLKKLKIEARDLGKLQQSNETLKKEIELLKQRALEERKEIEQKLKAEMYSKQDQEIKGLKAQVDELLKSIDQERIARITAENNLNKVESRYQQQLQEFKHVHAVVNAPCSNCENMKKSYDKQVLEFEDEIQSLRIKLTTLETQKQITAANADTNGQAARETEKSAAIAATQQHVAAEPKTALPSIREAKTTTKATVPIKDNKQSIALSTHNHTMISPVREMKFATPGSIADTKPQFHRRKTITGYHPITAHEPLFIPQRNISNTSGQGGGGGANGAESESVTARKALEDEVSRLRRLSLEQQSLIESLRRRINYEKESHTPPPAPSKADAKAKDAGNNSMGTPKLKSGKSKETVASAEQDRGSRALQRKPSLMEAIPPPSNAEWSRTWDDEDDSSESSSANNTSAVMTTLNNSITSATINTTNSNDSNEVAVNPAAESTMKTFERNLDLWRLELRQGIKVKFWEGQKINGVEVLIKLDSAAVKLDFDSQSSRRGFGLFQRTVDIACLYLTEILECLPGAEIKDTADQNLLMSIVAKHHENRAESRILAMKLNSREERNAVLSKLRALAVAAQNKDSASRASRRGSTTSQAPPTSGGSHLAMSAATNVNILKKHQSMPSMTRALAASRSTNQLISQVNSTASAAETPMTERDPRLRSEDSVDMQSNPLNQRASRRMTFRDSVIEEKLSQSSKEMTANPMAAAKSAKAGLVTTITPPNLQAADAVQALKEMQVVLNEEREKHERLKLQVMMMNNELVEKDELINTLKRNEQAYEQKLSERDNMYKQDNMVRLQLGKRLEQVLMDKEEALEEIDMLKMQLESLKATINSFSK